MTLSPELLNAIEAGCDGVSPGPWEADGVKNDGFTSYEVTDPNGLSVCDTYNAGTIEIQEEGGRAWDEQGRKNMAHIARLDPATVLELVAGYRRGLAGERGPVESVFRMTYSPEQKLALGALTFGAIADPPLLTTEDCRVLMELMTDFETRIRSALEAPHV
jgi:hypothetical protein